MPTLKTKNSPLQTKKILAASWLLCATAHAACPSWPTAERFVINGTEVTDQRTGLVWKRCSEGQTLSGNTCTGNANTYTHEQALAHAQSQNTGNSPSGWRLPGVKELASLADRGCANPAIDSVAFPNTPSGWYWTSSPYVGNSGAWFVVFNNGRVGNGNYSRSLNLYAVRLVRASQ